MTNVDGQAEAKLSEVYRSMIKRCESPTAQAYGSYGGRGIRVCKRWRNSFAAFVSDMGPKPSPDHSLDRIDNDGDYEPGNCRWATRSEQQRNRRGNRLLTWDGKTQTLTDWSEQTGIPLETLRGRLRAGWSVEKVLNEHPRRHNPHNPRRITWRGRTATLKEWSQKPVHGGRS